MKYCIAVQETLRREIVVEADSLEEAINHVESEYDKENIVLTADDACVEPDIFEVDWYSEKDIEEMEANYDIRNGSGRIVFLKRWTGSIRRLIWKNSGRKSLRNVLRVGNGSGAMENIIARIAERNMMKSQMITLGMLKNGTMKI